METPRVIERRGDRKRSAEEVAEYLVAVGTALLECGCPAYRVESAVRTIAALEGYRAEAFALPTGLFVNVRGAGPHTMPVHRMARITEWGLDLDRLVRVDDVFNAVARGDRDLAAAEQDLVAHRASPRPWPRAARWLAIGAVGGAAAVFFRGSLVDAGVSAVLALALHGAIFAVKKNPAARFLQDFVHAFLAAVLAYVASRLVSGASRDAIVLATIVSRVPGMTLTTGLAELAQKNLVSGGARLMEALVTLLSLVLGVAFAVALGRGAFAVTFEVQAHAGLGVGYQLGALLVASFGFGVLFSVPRAWLWTAFVSGAVGYGVSATALRAVPVHAAAFLASFGVCAFANGMAKMTDKPAQLFQIPGMMLLVPGTFGFLAVSALARGEIEGAARAVEVLLVAGGLVIGVIGANAVVPPRKIL